MILVMIRKYFVIIKILYTFMAFHLHTFLKRRSNIISLYYNRKHHKNNIKKIILEHRKLSDFDEINI